MCEPYQHKLHKHIKSHCIIIFFSIAFIFLLLAIVLPFLFKERVFINNKVFYGHGVDGLSSSTPMNAELIKFRNYYKDYIRTYAIGIIHTCVTTEINYHNGKTYSGGSYSGNTLPHPTYPKIELGTVCDITPWSLEGKQMGYSEFEDFEYTASMVNDTVIFQVGDTLEASALPIPCSTPGFPSFPGSIGGGCPQKVYEPKGVSQFFKNVNFHTFNALRVFAIIALVISVVILVILVIFCIVHCLSHGEHLNKKHRKLFKVLILLFWLLKVIWIIILILLLVIYHDIIKDLFEQSKALSIFAVGVSFWFFWIGFIFAVVVFVAIFFKLKMLKKHKHHYPHQPQYPVHHSMGMAAPAAVQMTSPTAPGADQ